ncbi:hypothetical protein HY605_04495, partial [Candidatus Peregrinibacteria bacterium]|nr:hypothetical protein [Candidatus Peregrinibacteria bacterium]
MSVNKSILLVDPSLLFDERKTDVIIALAKSKDYRIALPDEMVSLLKGRDFNELYQLLVDWDPRYAKVDRDWIFSDRIIDKTQILTEYTTTLSSLRVDLKAEQQVRYLEFQKILGEGSPLTRRISKELVRTSGALNCRVLSFSRNVRLLFSRLRGIVTISKEAYHWIKKVKLDIKKNLEKHGWVGVFYVLLFGIVTGLP